METLQITLFGHVSVVHPHANEPLKLPRSAQALLAYLLLHQHLAPRDVLMDVFWVNHPPDRARSSLTTALWRLRHLLEPGDVTPGTYLVTGSMGEVGFNWASNHFVEGAPATWRGSVEHVESGRIRYFTELDELVQFVRSFLDEMEQCSKRS